MFWISVVWTFGLSAVIPGSTIGTLALTGSWQAKQTQRAARWLAVVLTIVSWGIATYGLHLHFKFDWIRPASNFGTVVVFVFWIVCVEFLAPFMAMRFLMKRELSN